jgi:hypothetical protein
MRKRSTQNFYENELKMMEERPSKKAMEIGRRPPYYLQANKVEKQKAGTENGKEQRIN